MKMLFRKVPLGLNIKPVDLAFKLYWPHSLIGTTRPVSVASAPDYHLMVKNPTNLEKIRRQLDEMKTYRNNRQVLTKIFS